MPFNAGGIFLNLNTTVAGVPNPPVDPAASQAWVTSVFSEAGQFSIGLSAFHLDSASAPLHFVP